LPGCPAPGPAPSEVDSVGKNVLRGPPGANDKGPSKCRQTRDPQTRGQIPKRPQHQLPADWDTRSTRSHLGERPEHEIPDFCSRRGGPGGGPRSGPDFPERGWGSRGLGFESVPGGVPTGSTGGGRGRPKERRCGGQKGASKGWHGSSVEATVVPLRCYCGALANHRAQVGCVTGRTAPPRSLRRCRVGGFGPSAI
jgi:hypothetical protein